MYDFFINNKNNETLNCLIKLYLNYYIIQLTLHNLYKKFKAILHHIIKLSKNLNLTK